MQLSQRDNKYVIGGECYDGLKKYGESIIMTKKQKTKGDK